MAIGFLMKFLRPFFLLTLGVRLYSILYIIEALMKKDALQVEILCQVFWLFCERMGVVFFYENTTFYYILISISSTTSHLILMSIWKSR